MCAMSAIRYAPQASAISLNLRKSISFGNASDSFENGIINDTFNTKKIDDLTYVFEKEFSIKDADGKVNNFVLQKKYTFKAGEYLFQLDVSVIADENATLNLHDAAYTLRTAPQIGPHYDSKRDRYENRTLIIFTNKKFVEDYVNDKFNEASIDKKKSQNEDEIVYEVIDDNLYLGGRNGR